MLLWIFCKNILPLLIFPLSINNWPMRFLKNSWYLIVKLRKRNLNHMHWLQSALIETFRLNSIDKKSSSKVYKAAMDTFSAITITVLGILPWVKETGEVSCILIFFQTTVQTLNISVVEEKVLISHIGRL